MKNKRLLIILLSLCFINYGFSQVNEPQKDSTEAIYKEMEDYSKRSTTTKLLHWLIFKTDKESETKTLSTKKNYSAFEDKIIRDIHIESHDPFGFSFTDSTETANSWLEKTGNKLHAKSKDFAIKNYLIFKRNRPLDSLLLIESERLLRSQKFIRDVEITVRQVEESRDSVDVYITTLDSWSLTPSISISKSKMKLQFKERNYMGRGHQLKIGVENRFDDGKFGHDLLYSLPNIKNTYLGASLGHSVDLDGFYNKRVSAQRPFFSPAVFGLGLRITCIIGICAP